LRVHATQSQSTLVVRIRFLQQKMLFVQKKTIIASGLSLQLCCSAQTRNIVSLYSPLEPRSRSSREKTRKLIIGSADMPLGDYACCYDKVANPTILITACSPRPNGRVVAIRSRPSHKGWICEHALNGLYWLGEQVVELSILGRPCDTDQLKEFLKSFPNLRFLEVHNRSLSPGMRHLGLRSLSLDLKGPVPNLEETFPNLTALRVNGFVPGSTKLLIPGFLSGWWYRALPGATST
jgi:hypothetical protein